MNSNGKLIRALRTIGALSVLAMIPAVMCAEVVTTGSSEAALAYLAVSSLNPNPIHPIVTSSSHDSIHPLSSSNHWDSSELTMRKSCARQFGEKALARDFWGMIRVGLFCPSTVYSY